MFLYICKACHEGRHDCCEIGYNAPNGEYGGSRCRCFANDHNQYVDQQYEMRTTNNSDSNFIPNPDSMWLVVVECRYEVIRVCASGKGFYIPGQEPCWGFSHVAEWIREIEVPQNIDY